ncbi:hypothetical protein PPERSA_01590 [Pseudocohnilembus persalinus]|uniref:Uncharacterized protein n=1 Tax=Pseudocohnilembus persalinus TaxID=266149 RepID=A0A0V0QHW5_PSEPJ|nr:hypothetical protein PPERSA_01590 [Pseudocohnilembus persalinus]|eukprot:KRX01720.1 hypothetical protein PPERSA_01590 [Pseudocohnilembus persalinus]
MRQHEDSQSEKYQNLRENIGLILEKNHSFFSSQPQLKLKSSPFYFGGQNYSRPKKIHNRKKTHKKCLNEVESKLFSDIINIPNIQIISQKSNNDIEYQIDNQFENQQLKECQFDKKLKNNVNQIPEANYKVYYENDFFVQSLPANAVGRRNIFLKKSVKGFHILNKNDNLSKETIQNKQTNYKDKIQKKNENVENQLLNLKQSQNIEKHYNIQVNEEDVEKKLYHINNGESYQILETQPYEENIEQIQQEQYKEKIFNHLRILNTQQQKERKLNIQKNQNLWARSRLSQLLQQSLKQEDFSNSKQDIPNNQKNMENYHQINKNQQISQDNQELQIISDKKQVYQKNQVLESQRQKQTKQKTSIFQKIIRKIKLKKKQERDEKKLQQQWISNFSQKNFTQQKDSKNKTIITSLLFEPDSSPKKRKSYYEKKEEAKKLAYKNAWISQTQKSLTQSKPQKLKDLQQIQENIQKLNLSSDIFLSLNDKEGPKKKKSYYLKIQNEQKNSEKPRWKFFQKINENQYEKTDKLQKIQETQNNDINLQKN